MRTWTELDWANLDLWQKREFWPKLEVDQLEDLMKCRYYKIMYCNWNEHLSSNPIKCVYHILSLNCLETDQIKGIKTLQICSCFEVLVLCQLEVIDISSLWYYSPLGRSALTSNCFALKPPLSNIITLKTVLTFKMSASCKLADHLNLGRWHSAAV